MATFGPTIHHQFAADLTDAQIDAKVTVAAMPLTGLSDLPADVAAYSFELTAKSIFVPSQQTRQILRDMQGLARTYAQLRYTDSGTFLRYAYASDSEQAGFEPQLGISCLLGLPGVGKSAVVMAFERLFPATTADIPDHGTFPIHSAWRMTVKAGAGLGTLASPHLRHTASLGML